MEPVGYRTEEIYNRYNITSDGDLRDAARKLDIAVRSQRVAARAVRQCAECEAPGRKPEIALVARQDCQIY
jgi:hypothetical protein